jgi:hypothetical protein
MTGAERKAYDAGIDAGWKQAAGEGHASGYREGHADGKRIGQAEALWTVQLHLDRLIHPIPIPTTPRENDDATLANPAQCPGG